MDKAAQPGGLASFILPCGYVQLLNLNAMIWVAQSRKDVLFMYSVVYQNVQSSAGSICI